MYARLLSPQKYSFFLLGPRAIGKSTWLRKHYSDALWFNLLSNEQYLNLLQDKGLFRRMIEASTSKWVVVDEVQRLPELLNEVHDLIAIHGDRIHFALSGSSARKLRRGGVNLLAGRALTRKMFPLTAAELDFNINIEDSLRLGMLPDVHVKPEIARDFLRSYVTTYLREEIQQEALTRNLDSFARFLSVASIANGEIINVAGISRDCGVTRTTCQNYFEILVDTLVATFVPAWQPRAKFRERGKPKFYFFDAGVVNALAADFDLLSRADSTRGKLLETWFLSEMRAASEYYSLDLNISYWRDGSGKEVDFIIQHGRQNIGVKLKSSKSWRSEYAGGLLEIPLDKRFVLYLGDTVQKVRDVKIWPLKTFLETVHKNKGFDFDGPH